MKDKEKHAHHDDPHHDHHDEHEHDHDHEHDHKKKKKKKRGSGGLVLFLVLLLIILLALMWHFRDEFGLGKGSGDKTGTDDTSTSTVNSSDTTPEFNSDVTVIRIEQNDIYFGSEKCADIDELKEKITAAGSGKKYKLEQTALEDTYNKVREVLLELKGALDLEIDFGE